MQIDHNNLKGILFDFDGTLVDTLPLLYRVYQTFLSSYGHRGSREEFQELMGSLREIVQALKEKKGLNESIEELERTYRSILHSLYGSGLQLFPGARAFLEQAKNRNLRLAIVTSARLQLVESFLQEKELQEFFDEVVTPAGLKAGKPSPEIYVKALELLSLAPQEAIAVEDSERGAQAAVSAGISTLFVTHGRETIFKNDLRQKCLLVHGWKEIASVFSFSSLLE